jgi:hypothetical protein
MRTWTKLTLAVLLALSFTLAPAHADELTADKIARLQKEVDKLKEEVENLKRGTAQDIREIKELLRSLAPQGPVVSRSAYGSPGAGNSAMPAPGTARVTLRNRYHATATIHVNGQTHTVPAYSSMIVADVPLGPITYDVFVDGYGLIQPATTVALNPGGRDINVFPVQP